MNDLIKRGYPFIVYVKNGERYTQAFLTHQACDQRIRELKKVGIEAHKGFGGVNSVDVLRNQKACAMCLKEKCNKKCEHVHNYTLDQLEKAYDEAITYIESRPKTCQYCGRGCFDIDKFCPHCGADMRKKREVLK
ncbi:MAG: hypothetical protein IJ435_03620 [Clostridia bacterium]|nr:hypothetical protein [Clostridia bacterium]